MIKMIRKDEGDVYTPGGHDAAVLSRSIYKGAVDVHVTSFPAGAGMEEEVHQDLSHIFLVMEGCMEVLQQGEVFGRLECGDAVYIPAGDLHEIQNKTKEKVVFLAITFPDC